MPSIGASARLQLLGEESEKNAQNVKPEEELVKRLDSATEILHVTALAGNRLTLD